MLNKYRPFTIICFLPGGVNRPNCVQAHSHMCGYYFSRFSLHASFSGCSCRLPTNMEIVAEGYDIFIGPNLSNCDNMKIFFVIPLLSASVSQPAQWHFWFGGCKAEVTSDCQLMVYFVFNQNATRVRVCINSLLHSSWIRPEWDFSKLFVCESCFCKTPKWLCDTYENQKTIQLLHPSAFTCQTSVKK